jgi:hypothetical protein
MPAAALDLGRADLVMSPQKIAEALQVLAEGNSSAVVPPGASGEESVLGVAPHARDIHDLADPA